MAGSFVESNPYVGPQPFKRGQPLFGRAREVQELRYLLTSERIVLLYSPSGAGKSSLINAGLIPKLEQRFEVWGPTRIGAEVEGTGNRYVGSALNGLDKEKSIAPGTTWADYMKSRTWVKNPLIIFDQFEEIFRVDQVDKENQRAAFFEQTGEMLADSRIWALFVLREDYLAAMDPYARLIPSHFRNRYRLDRLDIDNAKLAIEQPTEEKLRKYAPGAVDALVGNLAKIKVPQPDNTTREEDGKYVEPLQLQVVCFDVWERMNQKVEDAKVITAADLGNVSDALSNYYATCVGSVAGKNQNSAERRIRDWFNDILITPDGVRNQVRKEQGLVGGKEKGLEEALAKQLEDTYLVRKEERGGSDWYELSHDRLIAPVRQNNAEWLDNLLTNFQKRAAQWKREGEPANLLLLGQDLARSLKERGKIPVSDAGVIALSREESHFLDACHAAERAAAQARRRFQQRIWTASVVGLSLAGLTVFAFQQKVNADRNLAQVQKFVAQGQVLEAYNLSQDYPDKSLAFLEQALIHDHESAEARIWLSTIVLDHNRWLPVKQGETFQADPSLKISVRDGWAQISNGSKEAKLRWLQEGEPLAAFEGPRLRTRGRNQASGTLWEETLGPANPVKTSGSISAVAFANEHLLTVSDHVQLWEDGGKASTPAALQGKDDFVLALSADGKYAVVWVSPQSAQIVNTVTGKVQEIPNRDGMKAVLSPDGSYAATYASDGLIQFWSPPTEKKLASLQAGVTPTPDQACSTGVRPPPKVSFSVRNKLAAIGETGNSRDLKTTGVVCSDAIVVNVETGERIGTPIALLNPLMGIAISPEGDRVTTAFSPGLLQVWDVKTGIRSALPMMDGAFWVDAVFSPDGTWLLTRSAVGARLWDGVFGFGQPISVLLPGDDVNAIAFAPDGHLVATGTKSGEARVWRIWIESSGSPSDLALLAELAAAVGGYKLDQMNHPQPIPDQEWIAQVVRLRDIAAKSQPLQKTVASFLREYFGIDRN